MPAMTSDYSLILTQISLTSAVRSSIGPLPQRLSFPARRSLDTIRQPRHACLALERWVDAHSAWLSSSC